MAFNGTFHHKEDNHVNFIVSYRFDLLIADLPLKKQTKLNSCKQQLDETSQSSKLKSSGMSQFEFVLRLFSIEYKLFIESCFGHISRQTQDLILWSTADLSRIRQIHWRTYLSQRRNNSTSVESHKTSLKKCDGLSIFAHTVKTYCPNHKTLSEISRLVKRPWLEYEWWEKSRVVLLLFWC